MDALQKLDRQINASISGLPFQNLIQALLFALVVIYGSQFATKLPTNVTDYMTKAPVVIAVLAFLINISYHRPISSLIIAFGLVTILSTASHRKILSENFKLELSDDDLAPFTAPDKIVAGAALSDEIFKVQRKNKLKAQTSGGTIVDDTIFQTAPYGFNIST
jgi:hypothetical protein